ncbi:MAG: 4-(cytidine 5'-diphospho)-2-C-methyl-D-erythritol kinase [Planctomycetaceae bacterium]|nr:4-(cytidine 5'-diphospho)-2-C-methyl-D-erythritol kinase [Planctomycetaceae bacterium]
MRIARRGDALVVEAPAKVNLHLEVLGRRLDRFHDLDTVMLAVNLRDTLILRPAPSGEFRLRQRFALPDLLETDGRPPDGDSNLVLKAARMMAESAGVSAGVEVELFKRIPWQAGLGGGSSDAAGTLLGLNRLWDLNWAPGKLHEIAARLGSDLNFFIEQTPLAVCRGRGEMVESRPLARRINLVIAQPSGGLSTAAVFGQWTSSREPSSSEPILSWLAGGFHRRAMPELYNALQRPAANLHPGVRRMHQLLNESGLSQVQMSGSGSACFGVCDTHRQARLIARRLRSACEGRCWAVSSAG